MPDSIISDWRGADVSPRLRAMFEYAAKLTKRPAEIGREDIELLRVAGLDDREILDTAEVASYFNFVNRMAEGLGVEVEER